MADGDAGNWTELLPQNPLFYELREEGSEPCANVNLLCEIRGDLFVWSSSETALLTTNLKRIKAHPYEPQRFQTLVCTKAPLTPITKLLPDPLGQHIALCSQQSLSVLKLTRGRGEHGEFGGGQRVVTCRVIPVASDLFSIHHHTLHLLHTEWHPTHPTTLSLLTSDSVLRLFSLANPNVPLFRVALTPYATCRVHACLLEDSVVAFCAGGGERIFGLRDTGDVFTVSLSPDSVPSPPLPMHPLAEDNYGNEATALLALLTTPLTLIIANSSGMLYHCLFLEKEKEEEQEEEEVGGQLPYSAGELCVVECVHLDLCTDDTESPLSLVADSVLPYRYFAIHSAGVHVVTMPWLEHLHKFTTSDVDSLMLEADSRVEYLIATEDSEVNRLQGIVFISEPLLGATLVAVTSDWECLVLTLPSPLYGQYVISSEAMPTKARPQIQQNMSDFEKIIRDILANGEHPPILSQAHSKDLSQQECFDFLRSSIQALRSTYLLQQRKAKGEIQHRIDILLRQKEQQFKDLVYLRDEREEAEERVCQTRRRLEERKQRGVRQMERLERVLCVLDAQSPYLSDAEEAMSQEMSKVSSQVEKIHYHLQEAKEKLNLGYGRSVQPSDVTLSQSQYRTVCGALAETGKRVAALKLQVSGLIAMVPS